MRVNYFYAIARKHRGIVIGTSNRTEFVQGYATKYGTPMSCDFGVLDELYKTDIREIADTLKVPQCIIEREPTTGFYSGQTHKDELGASVEDQDAAAYLLFEKNLSICSIIKRYGGSHRFLDRFYSSYVNSEHKRALQQNHVQLGMIHEKLFS